MKRLKTNSIVNRHMKHISKVDVNIEWKHYSSVGVPVSTCMKI